MAPSKTLVFCFINSKDVFCWWLATNPEICKWLRSGGHVGWRNQNNIGDDVILGIGLELACVTEVNVGSFLKSNLAYPLRIKYLPPKMPPNHPKFTQNRIISRGIWRCLKRQRDISRKAMLSDVKTACRCTPALNRSLLHENIHATRE